MSAATKILREEHDTILEMLQTLEGVANKVEAQDSVPLQLLVDLQEFFALFADRSHHGKEEELLFPFLEKKGVPRAGGPLGCMLTEHDEGRAFVRTMRSNAEGCAHGDPPARQAWAEAARHYANLLRNHIWKENEILFQIADRLLSTEEQALLAAEFAKIESERLDPEVQARLQQIKTKFVADIAASAR